MAKVNFRSQRTRRHRRVRAKISGALARPRLSIFRSNKHISAQLIDDIAGRTLIAFSDVALPRGEKAGKLSAKVARSFLVGEQLAKKALTQKIRQVVFDRGSYAYTGRVKALAEGARHGGLKF